MFRFRVDVEGVEDIAVTLEEFALKLDPEVTSGYQ